MLDLIESDRFLLWYIPEFPIDRAWVRGRDIENESQHWRLGLLEDIEKNGLNNPVGVYGHTPKGPLSLNYLAPGEPRCPDYYVKLGTNRVWCCKQLGWKTMPAVVSINHGSTPKWEGHSFPASALPKYFKDGVPWVNHHGFGITQAKTPEDTYRDFKVKE